MSRSPPPRDLPSPESRARFVQRVLTWTVNLLTTILLAVVAFIGRDITKAIDRLEDRQTMQSERLTAIEANRFTAADGVAMQKELSRLWQELANYPTRAEVPPPLFKQQVDGLTNRLDRMEDRLLRLEQE